MTDSQLTAILGALGTLGAAFLAAVRWAVNRLTKALDDNTASNRDIAKAQVEHASSLATLASKIDSVHDWVHTHTPLPGDHLTMSERFARADSQARDEPTPTELRALRPPSQRRRKGAI